MASINEVTLLGNLGGDPDIRAFPSGDKWATFSVATNKAGRTGTPAIGSPSPRGTA